MASILAQTFTDFELLICDDASPGAETVQVGLDAQRSDPRVQYIRRPANLGMPRNLNEGLRAARGEYLAVLHDGDIYRDDLLERWVKALESCPRAAFAFNDYQGLASDGKVIATWRAPLAPCNQGSVLLDLMFSRKHFDSPVWGTVMMRRSAYEQTGEFDERFGFHSDVAMWIRMAEHFDVAYVDSPLISLPSRDTLPREFSMSFFAEKRILWSIHWHAHVNAPANRTRRIARYCAHVVFDAAISIALALRHFFRSCLTQRASSGRDSS